MITTAHLHDHQFQLARLQLLSLAVDAHLNSNVDGMSPFDVVVLELDELCPTTRLGFEVYYTTLLGVRRGRQ